MNHLSGHPCSIADFVEECGGLDTLEHLQNHDNEEIYNKVEHTHAHTHAQTHTHTYIHAHTHSGIHTTHATVKHKEYT
jgi:hypothetical protein